MSKNAAPRCAKCDVPTEVGFVLDNAHSGRVQSGWVEGPPERSFWFGIKLGGREQIPIMTYRCPRCGYLESYARPD